MYGLLSRITSGLEDLRNKFEQHVRKAGLAAVKKILPAPGAVTETGKPEVMVCLLAPARFLADSTGSQSIRRGSFVGTCKVQRICQWTFPCRTRLQRQSRSSELYDTYGRPIANPQACRAFCNSNPACSSPTRSPELLATYVDQMLKKTNKESDAESLEAALSSAVRLLSTLSGVSLIV